MGLTTTLIIVLIGFVILAIFINWKLTSLSNNQKPSEEILEYLKTTNVRLNEQGKSFNDRLDNAAKIIGNVQKDIGEFSEIGRGMRDLQDFLKSPKLRGNIGEQILKDMLSQFLPKQSFKLQYTFKSGDKVDAAVFTSAGIISVDSKFPMENFRKLINDPSAKVDFERDVKKHIDDISRKYILNEEGTVDYALMYVPSEAIYYEIANNEDLFDYSTDKRVLPVSPTTFYAYLKAILMSFEGQKIEAQAKEILSSLRAIQKDYEKTDDALSILQRHLTNAYNMMGSVFSSFENLGHKISSTRNLGSGVKKETKEIE
jgi:DNA recombination protein RmuC